MKKNDFSHLLNTLGISSEQLFDAAFETGMIKRKRLLTADDILFAFCNESTEGTVSYNDLASKMEDEAGVEVCRQAIWKKVTEPCKMFFEKVLGLVMVSKIDKGKIEVLRISGQYKRLIVQDSTIIKLPARLFEIFSGVSNGHSQVCNARIQGVYDLLSERFISFSIDPYSKNDLKAAPETKLEEGDLVLRDRGYLINDEIQRHIDNGADCIYRYKFGMLLLDPVTKKPIDILSKLKKSNKLDIEVLLNNKSKTKVRLSAVLVKEEIANIRRMKAKKENKNKPTKVYLELLSWSVFITTIPIEQADFIELYSLYEYRWRIEIIFKNWKSNMEFSKIHNVSKIQLSVLLLARFIMIVIFNQHIFRTCRNIVKKHLDKDLSLLKVTHYLVRNPSKIIKVIIEITNYSGNINKNIRILAKYCSYDKRKRVNFEQKMDKLFMQSHCEPQKSSSKKFRLIYL